MPAQYVISDTHFGHANIIKYCDRPFSSVQEMDRVLIDNWNSVVRPEDTVWHLGDFGLGDFGYLADVCSELNGHIILIQGNHDRAPAKMLDLGIDEVYQVWKGTLLEKRVYFSHRPNYDLKGPVLHLYGHVHNNPLGRKTPPRSYNVSVENIDYRPIPLSEALDLCL